MAEEPTFTIVPIKVNDAHVARVRAALNGRHGNLWEDDEGLNPLQKFQRCVNWWLRLEVLRWERDQYTTADPTEPLPPDAIDEG